MFADDEASKEIALLEKEKWGRMNWWEEKGQCVLSEVFVLIGVYRWFKRLVVNKVRGLLLLCAMILVW